MMPSYETEGEGWKSEIITNPPEDEEDFDEDRFAYKKEVKSQIVKFVAGSSGKSKQEIIEEIDKRAGVIQRCIEELKDEDVLEVEK